MSKLPLYHLDFETYSTADLKIVGPVKYAMCEDTEILCSAFADHNKRKIDLVKGHIVPEWMYEPYDLAAHNVDFEYNIIKRQLVPLGARMPERMFCTMAMAQSLNLPGALEKIPKVLRLPFTKDKAGQNAINRLCKPRKPTEKDSRTRYEICPKWQHYYDALYVYCKQDVYVEMQLFDILPKLNKYERRIWEVNFEINNEIGTPVDVEALEKFDAAVEEYRDIRRKLLPFITDNAVQTPNQIQKIKRYCVSHGVEIGNLNKDTLSEIIKDENTPPEVKEVLKIRLETGGKAVSKYAAFRASEINGRVYNMFRFCGASQTRRFSGSRVQLQNLHRGHKDINSDEAIRTMLICGADALPFFYDDSMKVFNTCIRGMIKVEDNNALAVCDYSTIEAIVTFWFAEEWEALEKIRNGVDIYIDLAEFVFKKKFTKKSLERQLGKTGILGCGFGMGVIRFISYCAEYGVEIDEDTARMVVYDGYRKRYEKVVKFWYKLQDACKMVIRTGISQRVGKLKIILDRNSLPHPIMQIILPDTSRLTYWRPTIKGLGIHFYSINDKGQWAENSTWGGKLTENVVQATARSLLAWSLVRLHNAGIRLILHVHDEAGAEFKKEDAETGLKTMKMLMEKIPKWAKGLPVKVGDDAWIGTRYRK